MSESFDGSRDSMPVRHEATASPCVFCDVVAGSTYASVVHEDDATLAFMDLRQPNLGHVLVIPKRHVEMLDDLDPDTAARLMRTTVTVARAIRSTFAPPGLNLWQSNGTPAFQEVPHVHVHLVPRYPDDGLLRIYVEKPAYPERAELDRIATQIRESIDRGG